MKFELETLGKFKVIHLIGNLDSDAKRLSIDKAIIEQIDKGHHDIVFNLERTTYLDSMGISVFVNCLCEVQSKKGSVFLIAEDQQVLSILEMVGIVRLIKTYKSQAEFIKEQKIKK